MTGLPSDADLMAAGAVKVARFGDAVLLLGDSAKIAPRLPRPAAIIGDPPYGQKHKPNVTRNEPHLAKYQTDYPIIAGDHDAFIVAPWVPLADTLVLFGAHRFGHRLPASTLLVWYKRPSGKRLSQGDGEAAAILLPPPATAMPKGAGPTTGSPGASCPCAYWPTNGTAIASRAAGSGTLNARPAWGASTRRRSLSPSWRGASGRPA